MFVILSTIFGKERLEDVAEAPGIMVPAIRTTKMDAITAKMISVAIKILLKYVGE